MALNDDRCRYCGRETNDPERICDVCRRRRLLGPSPLQAIGSELGEIKRFLEEQEREMRKAGKAEQSEFLQQRVRTVELLLRLFNVQIAETSIDLVDANKVERMSADERIAGFLLAWATLFAGALLERWLVPSASLILTTTLLGALAGYFYRRAQKAQREMKESRGQVPLDDLVGDTEASQK
jgi:hypothetical protein